jgi:hypothetical protein
MKSTNCLRGVAARTTQGWLVASLLRVRSVVSSSSAIAPGTMPQAASAPMSAPFRPTGGEAAPPSSSGLRFVEMPRMVSAECQARRPDLPQSKRISLSMTPSLWAARFSHRELLPVEARLGS